MERQTALLNPNAFNACILLTSITLDYQLVHSTAMLRLLHRILEGRPNRSCQTTVTAPLVHVQKWTKDSEPKSSLGKTPSMLIP
jgi:hypothetical protein